MCTVSVVEETQSRVELKLKDMLYIVEGYVPLRNWYSLVPFGREKTLIIVPVSEAVASKVPSLFRAIQDNGARWASTTFNALSSTASKIKTDPDVGATYVESGGAWDGRLSPVSSLGLGNGYAM
jgi:hypothetical protein